ncbi:MAG: hypothetical protein HZA91_14655, partial [Verrucomicrobia bacterium]|nr:hypothetical protein [Verrucomicrobiota bacterium]
MTILTFLPPSETASDRLRPLLLAVFVAFVAQADAAPVVLSSRGASPRESLAARETRRYVYVRTGQLASVNDAATLPKTGDVIVVARKDRALAKAVVGSDATTKAELAALGPEQYLLKTIASDGRRVLLIAGGDDAGVLYGAYRFAEKLGVRFYLHGDVVPDERLASLPDVKETGKPLFDTRGIQPFHDFPEGPDWWNRDDYLAYVSQLAKMRMNFLGLHCYPEGGVGPEPLVWIGQPSDLDPKGRVKSSYPARWADTRRVNTWGYAAMNVTEFAAGAAGLFAPDFHGPDVHGALFASDVATDAVCNEIFNRAGAQMAAVMAHARALGVKTCIGTETPLTIPKRVQERLKQQGKDPKDIAVVRSLYEGMFRRIAKLYPVDYYWLWTPENWTWSGNKPEQFEATTRDMQAALDALKKLSDPFTLATSGWVLGPQHDRAALDKFLPKNVPMSCINRQVGHAPVEPGFEKITGRPKWAIPWMENDPNLVAPQPWVGRMRSDAVDAKRYGCTGLLGIHWRTKVLAANVAALADAAWDQSWAANQNTGPQRSPLGPIGGKCVSFKAPVAGTDESPLYQTVRYDVDGYELEAPNGSYAVTLKFNEPHYTAAGKRVFGVLLQGRDVIHQLDVFAKVGRNKALDSTFTDVTVSDGRLHIEFTRETELPCIAGIVVAGKNFTRKINCGGPAWNGYEADTAEGSKSNKGRDRAMPVEEFYRDFARASFGANVAEAAGKLFAKIDGTNLPEPSTWLHGPGGIKPNGKPWSEVKASYAFVDELAALRSQVKGAGNLERFDYWLNTYRCMAAMAELGSVRGELDALVAKLKTQQALAKDAVAVRVRLSRLWEKMLIYQ